MMRPGNLRGIDVSIQKPRNLGIIDDLTGGGGGGKRSFEPPPGPPPPGTWTGSKRVTHAINKVTKKYYVQDPGCPEGELRKKCKDVIKNVPTAGGPGNCKFTECCDVALAQNFWGTIFCHPGECDHPDTPTDCEDDPAYLELPEKTYKDCKEVRAEFKKLGIPESFANTHCENEDIPEDFVAPKKVGPKKMAPMPANTTTVKKQVLPPCKSPGKPCGKAPKMTCRVPGHGIKPPVCYCGRYICPTPALMAAMAKKKGKKKGLGGFGEANKKWLPLVLLGVAVFAVVKLRA